MKVGIIRCMQTEDFCPGTTDFKVIAEKRGVFDGVDEDIEIVGFINCGGCPAKKINSKSKRPCEKRRRHDSFCFMYTKRYTHWLSLPIC